VSGARNVLICNERFLARYGHDRTLVLLGRELASRGHHVAFACLRCERRVLAGISNDIHQLNLPDDAEFSAADRLAAEMIEATWVHDRPDVLVTGGWPFFGLAARSAAHGVPSLFIDAGAVPHDGYGEPSLSIQREVRRLRQRTLPFIDRILPNSDFTRDSQTLPDRGREQGVTTVRLGADHLDMGFDPDQIDRDAEQHLLKRLDSLCRAGSTLVLALGRFESEGYKNSPMAFDVFGKVRERFPGAVLLLLVGPGEVAVPPDLAGDTICLSTLSDTALREVMLRCKLGLSLSLWEGFNLPLAEMQWIERPVLAFNVGAHPEVVADPWFLCASSTEMARKAVRILTQGVPETVVTRRRFEQVKEDLRWGNTLARWTEEIESLAATATSRLQPGRRLVLIDVTRSGSDPSDSEVGNVTRRLAGHLLEDPELLVFFGAWDCAAGEYVLPTASQRSLLEDNAGPRDWLGRLADQLVGEFLPLERLLDAADPRCSRSPVLFFPEPALDGSVQQRVAWGREKGFRLCFILHATAAVHQAQCIDGSIDRKFPGYLEAASHADAIWSHSPSELRQFELYCSERRAILPSRREVVPLPGQLGDVPRPAVAPPDTAETRILSVCSIEPLNHHRALIEAFQKLRAQRPDLPLRLVLIGSEWPGTETLAEWVRETARRDGRIEWRRAVSQAELEGEFAHAAFSVYPSVAEGFGLPVLESLWMGKPCICHEAGAMAELAAEGGCIAVDVKDPIELSIAMERLCSDSGLVDALRRQAAAREIGTWSDYGTQIASRLREL
jgi:glycosyltransferase involved in cell wall biosynthesis